MIFISSRYSKTVCAALIASLLLGCEATGMNEYDIRNRESEIVKSNIEQHRDNFTEFKVERIEQPPVRLKPIEQSTDTSFLTKKLNYSTPATGLPLSLILDDILPSEYEVRFGAGIQPNQKVTINAHQGSLASLLNLLENQLKIGFTPSERTLKVEQFVSRTFELELPPGRINDQIGGANKEESDGKAGSTSVDGQYVTTSSSDVDVFSEVASGVKALLQLNPDASGGEASPDSLVGSVEPIPALSRIVVRTSPARMQEVVNFVEQAKQSLTKQVELEVQVLEFRSNLGHERGIDWNLLRDIGSGYGLSFFVPGTSLVASSASPGFAFNGGGKWSGSTALIKALNEQGQVSTQTPITILVQNHQTNHITQQRTVEFIENIKTNTEDGVVSTDTERGKRNEGVDFIVVPNIQRDHVYLRTSGMLTKIEKITPQVVGGETLMFPLTRQAKINFGNKLKYGQTIVIASVSQFVTTTESNTFLGVPLLGSNTAEKQRIDTLVLLTPRRADG